MSRRSDCHDNAVAESFFSLLKTERIKRKIFKTRNEVRSEIYNYIEFFYNPRHRLGNNDSLSPMTHEKQYCRVDSCPSMDHFYQAKRGLLTYVLSKSFSSIWRT